MSYDTSIVIRTSSAGRWAEVEECGNYTSNIGGVYRAAMPGPYEGGGRYNGTGESEPRGGLPGLSGLPCREALPVLLGGLAYMREHERELRDMEPDNGWGDYSGAVAYLRRIADACEEHDLGTLAVSW